jgi:hypothetical protein
MPRKGFPKVPPEQARCRTAAALAYLRDESIRMARDSLEVGEWSAALMRREDTETSRYRTEEDSPIVDRWHDPEFAQAWDHSQCRQPRTRKSSLIPE